MLDQVESRARGVVAMAGWAPDWALSLAVLAVSILAGEVAYHLLFRVLTRLLGGRAVFWRSLVSGATGPARMALMIMAVFVGTGIAPLTPLQTLVIRHVLTVCFISLLGWLALSALSLWTTIYLRRFRIDIEDNLLARKHVTQSRILQRVAATMIVLFTVAADLMTFESVRQYGVSLLASAGAAGIVLGLALQPLLKNIVAGVQLAITQPIRLEDAVIVEGEWGNVEEITSTYVVVRLWDWRRMVLPLSYFIEKPFQNWTRSDAALIGTVMLYVDYSAPIGEMRRRLTEIAEASPIWDRRVVNMQVTDFSEDTMQVRMLVSAGSAGRTFDLRCEVREKMIAWLQAEHPHALPRRRAEIDRLPRDAAWVDERTAVAAA
jgi:small-conductance mechanosensitive channel